MIYVGGAYFLSGIGFLILNDKLNWNIQQTHPDIVFFYFMSWFSMGIVSAVIVLTERFWNKSDYVNAQRLRS